MKERTSITLRQRLLPSGRTTLYLDYTCNGRRRFESLKLFLEPEKSRADKQKNRETLKLAEVILAKRKVQIQNKEFGFKQDFANETNFYDYYKALCAQRLNNESHNNGKNWRAALKHLEKYDPHLKKRLFSEITPRWIQGFKDYLEKDAYAWGCDFRERTKDHPLARNSKLSYFNKLRACINQALEERVISTNPMLGIEGFKAEEGKRMYLTIDEVRLLAQTPCPYPNIRRAFLFSCLTGLRRSDILKLTWSEVQQQGNFTRIIFKQKKTGGQEYLDISPQAAGLMGKRGKPEENVFADIHSPTCTNDRIKRWVANAGIRKEITFHCGRHTFAVMMLDLGTDIYTVSKLLGHRELSTTQIYAKVLDKNKQAAIARIPDMLSPQAPSEEKEGGD